MQDLRDLSVGASEEIKLVVDEAIRVFIECLKRKDQVLDNKQKQLEGKQYECDRVQQQLQQMQLQQQQMGMQWSTMQFKLSDLEATVQMFREQITNNQWTFEQMKVKIKEQESLVRVLTEKNELFKLELEQQTDHIKILKDELITYKIPTSPSSISNMNFNSIWQ